MSNLATSAPSSSVSPWLKAGLFLLLLIGLFFSRPTAAQFYRQVWTPAREGMKAELSTQQDAKPIGKLIVGVFQAYPQIGTVLAGLQSQRQREIEQLPAFWMEHTAIYDWKLVTYFRYDEKDCFSDYLGIAGTIINLGDGCQVEPYRTKGGS